MNVFRDYPTKWIKSQRRRNTILSHLYVESKNDMMNLFTKQTQAHRYRKHIYGLKGMGGIN